MRLVVGLGNPGRSYASTRHNVGFLVVDRLAERWGASFDRKQFKADVGSARIGPHPVMLCKPQTFMNLSGESVVALRGYYKLDNAQVVVVHDDLEVPFGEVRHRVGGGHGGHNGLRDVSRRIGADYQRVRVGIGRPPPGWDVADYVLARFNADEAAQIPEVVDAAAAVVETALGGN